MVAVCPETHKTTVQTYDETPTEENLSSLSIFQLDNEKKDNRTDLISVGNFCALETKSRIVIYGVL